MRDPKEFRERFLRWKNGENYWEQRGINMNTQQSLDLQADLLTPEQLTAIEAALEYYTSGKDAVDDVPPETTDDDRPKDEVTVTGYRPIELKTFYPLGKHYPLTGHSQLNIPITKKVADEYGLYGLDLDSVPLSERKQMWVVVDKKPRDNGYDLLTNNCADATLNYLNTAFGTKESPWLFTTPGDVRDYAINSLKGKKIKDKNGVETILIPRNKINADIISRKVLDLQNAEELMDNRYTGSYVVMREPNSSMTNDTMINNKPNLFRISDGKYVYQDSPKSEEIEVTPTAISQSIFDDPEYWDYTDAQGRRYTPKNLPQKQDRLDAGREYTPVKSEIDKYFNELAYRAENDLSSIALQGKYTLPAILAPALGLTVFNLGATPYINSALTSYFTADGLNDMMLGKIDWETALKLSSAGELYTSFKNIGKSLGDIKNILKLDVPISSKWQRFKNLDLFDKLRGIKFKTDIYHGSPVDFNIRDAKNYNPLKNDTGIHFGETTDPTYSRANPIEGGTVYKGRLKLKERPITVEDLGNWTPYSLYRQATIDENFKLALLERGITIDDLKLLDTGYMKGFADYMKDKGVTFRYRNEFETIKDVPNEFSYVTWDKDLPVWLLYHKYNKDQETIDKLKSLGVNDIQNVIKDFPIYQNPDNWVDFNRGKDKGIHINPKNRGKFNALKKRTGKTTEQLTHSKNPLTRKRAIFAKMAKRGWKPLKKSK